MARRTPKTDQRRDLSDFRGSPLPSFIPGEDGGSGVDPSLRGIPEPDPTPPIEPALRPIDVDPPAPRHTDEEQAASLHASLIGRSRSDAGEAGASALARRPRAAPSSDRPEPGPRDVGVIAMIAVALRLLVFLVGPAAEPNVAIAEGSGRHLELAASIAERHVFESDPREWPLAEQAVWTQQHPGIVDRDAAPETRATPGYPILLAIFEMVPTPGIAVLLLQAALSGLAAAAVYTAVGRLTGSVGAARVAALVVALHPALIFWSNQLVATTMLVTLLAGGLAGLVLAARRGWWWAAPSGLAFGAAALVQPVGATLAVAGAIWLLVSKFNRFGVVAALLLLCTATPTVAVWMARNAHVGVGWRLTTAPTLSVLPSDDALTADDGAARAELEAIVAPAGSRFAPAPSPRDVLQRVDTRRRARWFQPSHLARSRALALPPLIVRDATDDIRRLVGAEPPLVEDEGSRMVDAMHRGEATEPLAGWSTASEDLVRGMTLSLEILLGLAAVLGLLRLFHTGRPAAAVLVLMLAAALWVTAPVTPSVEFAAAMLLVQAAAIGGLLTTRPSRPGPPEPVSEPASTGLSPIPTPSPVIRGGRQA